MSAATMACPHCRARLRYARPAVARRVRCPACKGRLTVGNPAAKTAGQASPAPSWLRWLLGAAGLGLVVVLSLLLLQAPPTVPSPANVQSTVPEAETADPPRPSVVRDNPPASSEEQEEQEEEPPSRPADRNLAILVGILGYEDPQFQALAHTENDVEQLGKVLGGASYEVTLLTTTRGKTDPAARPTARNIRARLGQVLSTATRDDLVLVALAGHGISARIEQRGNTRTESYFCPSDARLPDDMNGPELNRALLSFTELFDLLERSSAGAKLLLVDACRDEPGRSRGIDVDSLSLPRRCAALFSCTTGQRSFETARLRHGVFFHFVLEGLRGKTRTSLGEVTWLSLVAHVIPRVVQEVPRLIGGGARQTPQLVINQDGLSPVLLAASTTP
jgi:hypothetical protein